MTAKNADLLLIQPPIHLERTEFQSNELGAPNLGLAYIAAVQRQLGREVAVIDAQALCLTPDAIVRSAVALRPSLIGISALTYQITGAHAVATALKAALPDTPIVLGGSHGAAVPERTLEEFASFDAVAVGEGELIIGELLDTLGNGGIHAAPGLYVRGGDVEVSRQIPPRISDLDALPHPALDLFPLRVYRPLYSRKWLQELPISFSRGCPFVCVFCSKQKGRAVRSRSPEGVLDELERDIVDFGCRQVVFSDENFTLDADAVQAFCEGMLKRGLAGKVRMICQSRVTVESETLQVMGRAGFSHVAFGIESGDPEILEAAAKGISLDDCRRAIAATKAAGITSDANFILGLPYETEASIKRTIDFACSLPLDYAKFFLLVPYPGTRVYEMARRGEGNLRLVSDDWRSYGRNLGNALELTTVSPARVARLQLLAYLRFYGPPRRWPHFFREYSAGMALKFVGARLADVARSSAQTLRRKAMK